MRVAARLAAVLSLWLALSGCLAGRHGEHQGSAVGQVLANAETGADIGNDPPQVSHDGLIVRRRVVLAFRIGTTGDLRRLDHRLALAARRGGLTAATVSPSVLDAADLERLAPNLVVALSQDATPADGQHLMRRAQLTARLTGLDVRDHEVASVLVHDLRFTLRTPQPGEVSRGIDREGILADALGSYGTRLGTHRLDIVYTGPLLSDRLLQSVRRGIARPAHVGARAVSVAHRSTRGTGVDLAG